MQKTMYWTVCATSFAICFFFSLYLVYMANERIAFVNVHLDTKNLCLNLFLVILFIATISENRTINSVSQNAKIFVVVFSLLSSIPFVLWVSIDAVQEMQCSILEHIRCFLFSFLVQTEFFQTEINFYYLKYDGQKVQQSHENRITLLFWKHSTPSVFISFMCVCVYLPPRMHHKSRRWEVLYRSTFMLNVKILNETFFSITQVLIWTKNVNTKFELFKLISFLLCWMSNSKFAREFKLNPVIKRHIF